MRSPFIANTARGRVILRNAKMKSYIRTEIYFALSKIINHCTVDALITHSQPVTAALLFQSGYTDLELIVFFVCIPNGETCVVIKSVTGIPTTV